MLVPLDEQSAVHRLNYNGEKFKIFGKNLSTVESGFLEPSITKKLPQSQILGVYILGVKTEVKLTIDIKQREQREQNYGDKNNNSNATKKNITGFYIENERIFGLQGKNQPSITQTFENLQSTATFFRPIFITKQVTNLSSVTRKIMLLFQNQMPLITE